MSSLWLRVSRHDKAWEAYQQSHRKQTSCVWPMWLQISYQARAEETQKLQAHTNKETQLPWLWKRICRALSLEKTHADPFRRTTLVMQSLPFSVPEQVPCGKTRKSSHWWKTLHMSHVWARIYPTGISEESRDDSAQESRGARTILLQLLRHTPEILNWRSTRERFIWAWTLPIVSGAIRSLKMHISWDFTEEIAKNEKNLSNAKSVTLYLKPDIRGPTIIAVQKNKTRY